MIKATGPKLLLAAAAAGTLTFGATLAHTDGWQEGEPGRWVPGTPMTDGQNVTDWSGLYVGGKLGGAWSDINWSENFAEFGTPGAGASFSPSSVNGGIFGGANLQMGQWIFGLEVSFLGMGLSESAVSAAVPTDTFSTEIDWLLMVEPRIGFTWDRTMVFVKGGWAGGDATLSATGAGSTPGTIAFAEANDFVDG